VGKRGGGPNGWGVGVGLGWVGTVVGAVGGGWCGGMPAPAQWGQWGDFIPSQRGSPNGTGGWAIPPAHWGLPIGACGRLATPWVGGCIPPAQWGVLRRR